MSKARIGYPSISRGGRKLWPEPTQSDGTRARTAAWSSKCFTTISRVSSCGGAGWAGGGAGLSAGGGGGGSLGAAAGAAAATEGGGRPPGELCGLAELHTDKG